MSAGRLRFASLEWFTCDSNWVLSFTDIHGVQRMEIKAAADASNPLAALLSMKVAMAGWTGYVPVFIDGRFELRAYLRPEGAELIPVAPSLKKAAA